MTAVEYILNLVAGEDASGKDVKVIDVLDINEIQQANQLFENKIMKANEEGFHSGQSMAHNGTCTFKSPKDYYNQTFKS